MYFLPGRFWFPALPIAIVALLWFYAQYTGDVERRGNLARKPLPEAVAVLTRLRSEHLANSRLPQTRPTSYPLQTADTRD